MTKSILKSDAGKLLLAALLVSAICNIVFLALIFKARIELAFAEDMVQTFFEMEREAHDSPEDIDQYVDYIEGYYPSGSKLSADSVLGIIVERSRENTLRRLTSKTSVNKSDEMRSLGSPE